LSDNSERVEFGSDAWFALADQVVKDIIAENPQELGSERLSICYVFTSPPAHLLHEGQSTIPMYMSIDHGSATVQQVERTDVDILMYVDYAHSLENGRGIQKRVPEEMEFRKARQEAAIESGLMTVKGGQQGLSSALLEALTELHNRLAVRTL